MLNEREAVKLVIITIILLIGVPLFIAIFSTNKTTAAIIGIFVAVIFSVFLWLFAS